MGNGTKTIITILALLVIGLITFIVTDAIINSNPNSFKKGENTTVASTEDKTKAGNESAKGSDVKYSKTSKYSKI